MRNSLEEEIGPPDATTGASRLGDSALTSRSRVLAALEHQQPDRVPIDVSGHRSSGIAAAAYSRLRNHLGLDLRPIRVYDLYEQLAVVDEDVLSQLAVDTIELGRGFAMGDDEWSYWVLPDGFPCLIPKWIRVQQQRRRSLLLSPSGRTVGEIAEGSTRFAQTYFPFADQVDFEAIPGALAECLEANLATPPHANLGSLALGRGAMKLRANSERAVLGLFGGSLTRAGQELYGSATFCAALSDNSSQVHAFLERLVEIYLAQLERFLLAVGPFIDILVFDECFTFDSHPQAAEARRIYREFFLPHHQRLWRRAKEVADVKVLMRCRSEGLHLLPDFIDAGLDAVQGLLFHTSEQDIGPIKAEFGRHISFWGGGPALHHAVSRGTPQEVVAAVQRQIELLAPGGSFVFQPADNVPAHVPPENIVAMFEAMRAEQS